MEDKSPDETTEVFLVKLLEKVSLIFKKLSSFDDNEEKIQQKRFSSKNKIHREIRILMRNKREISQAIQRAISIDALTLGPGWNKIERALKESYDKRRSNQEGEALKKIRSFL